ncbi:MAG: hypothetical protein BJ554DRAFT_7567, partial [Olpidium bornovanus]
MVRSAPLPTRSEARGGPRNGFEQARERLHVSAVPDSLPCRENEFADVLNHLQSALLEATGACICDVPPFQFVEINGMKLTEPAQAYIQLWEAISGQRVTAAHADARLTYFFVREVAHSVVLMDELDLLVTKKQDIMYNFFEWPSRPHAHLVVLAVANTMDLPERVLSNKVSSRLAVEIVEAEARDMERDGSGDDGRETPRVTMTIITRVCNEMYDSPNVDFVIKA